MSRRPPNIEKDAVVSLGDTTKMFLNSVISTPNARFMTMDIKDFYLGTPLKCYKYIRMQYNIIPDDIKE